MTTHEDDWLEAARDVLDEHAETLPPGVETRLNAARSEALAAPERPAWAYWRPALAFLALFTLAALLLPAPEAPPATAPEPALAEDDLMTSADLDLLEDLEFVAWLEVTQAGDEAS